MKNKVQLKSAANFSINKIWTNFRTKPKVTNVPSVHSCHSLAVSAKTGGAVEASGLQSVGGSLFFSSWSLQHASFSKKCFLFKWREALRYLGLGFLVTVAIKGLGVKHLKITSEWILEGRLVGQASLLALLVSYEEDKIGLIPWPGEGSECVAVWYCGRMQEDSPWCEKHFWQLASVVTSKKSGMHLQ